MKIIENLEVYYRATWKSSSLLHTKIYASPLPLELQKALRAALRTKMSRPNLLQFAENIATQR